MLWSRQTEVECRQHCFPPEHGYWMRVPPLWFASHASFIMAPGHFPQYKSYWEKLELLLFFPSVCLFWCGNSGTKGSQGANVPANFPGDYVAFALKLAQHSIFCDDAWEPQFPAFLVFLALTGSLSCFHLSILRSAICPWSDLQFYAPPWRTLSV